ncbi:hypothetical protein EX30DRAFT_61630 [Ascodesmis nigricans]|uniref:Uncharacterized protein n=1 Tax=Ascodesmis nigricans TaxID=341454 RepID=A0A4S2MUH6_9PEZI|nr:hypothetical protein EX30DRAFT_61630 [Ascodesmis nigricans]
MTGRKKGFSAAIIGCLGRLCDGDGGRRALGATMMGRPPHMCSGWWGISELASRHTSQLPSIRIHPHSPCLLQAAPIIVSTWEGFYCRNSAFSSSSSFSVGGVSFSSPVLGSAHRNPPQSGTAAVHYRRARPAPPPRTHQFPPPPSLLSPPSRQHLPTSRNTQSFCAPAQGLARRSRTCNRCYAVPRPRRYSGTLPSSRTTAGLGAREIKNQAFLHIDTSPPSHLQKLGAYIHPQFQEASWSSISAHHLRSFTAPNTVQLYCTSSFPLCRQYIDQLSNPALGSTQD